jgi:hypothetical protein
VLNLTIVGKQGHREVSCSLVVIRIRDGSTSVGFLREMTSGGSGESD